MSRRDIAPVAASAVAGLMGATATADVTVTGIADDSRSVRPGDLVFCVRGGSFDPHTVVRDMASAGAVAFVVDRDVDAPAAAAVIRVDDVRRVVGPVASALLGHPSRQIRMVGVTGTNGKTSTVSFIASILRSQGHQPLVLGTLAGERTTPEPLDLQAALADAVAAGATHAVMEVSSHALVLGRVNGIVFDVAVFTNLSRDHIDFHGSMDAYRDAKFSLFGADRSRHAVVNVDDPYGRELAETCSVPVTTCGASRLASVEVSAVSVAYELEGVRVTVPVGGSFTVDNSLLAIKAAAVLGIPVPASATALAGAAPVPGRMEPVPTDGSYSVIVDYAHTPDALRTLLSTLRATAEGRVTVVFGCGGDRDTGKRGEMGRIAATDADVVWVTSDNPRSEDPMSIIASIVDGTQGCPADVHVESDRAKAIESAISAAGRGDIVVVAGKGHEPYQEIAGVRHDFSDVETARTAAARRSGPR